MDIYISKYLNISTRLGPGGAQLFPAFALSSQFLQGLARSGRKAIWPHFTSVFHKVGWLVCLVDVPSLTLVIGQAFLNKCPARLRYHRLRWKYHLCGFQDDLLFEDLILVFVVSERSVAIQHLVKNDTHWPDIYFGANFWWFIALHKCFWWKVPVCSHALRGQLDSGGVIFYKFAQTKICDFQFPLMKNQVLRLQVIVNDFGLVVVDVLEPCHNLLDQNLGFFFRDLFIFFQVQLKVRPLAVLEHSAEGIIIDLHRIVQLDDIGVLQLGVYFWFANCMLYIVLFDNFWPVRVKLVDFTGCKVKFVEVVSLVHLTESSPPQQAEQLIPIVKLGPVIGESTVLFFVVFLELLEKQQLFVPQVLLFLAKVTQLLFEDVDLVFDSIFLFLDGQVRADRVWIFSHFARSPLCFLNLLDLQVELVYIIFYVFN